jgi:hypothetical protein
MKYFLHSFFCLFALLTNFGSAQNAPCTNLDFESGITGWTVTNAFTGNTNNSCLMTSCCTGTAPTYTILSNGYVDPFMPSSPLNSQYGPGGSAGTKFIMLNNSSAGGKEQRLSQSFFVLPSNKLFKYAYKYVSYNGAGHACCDEPYMNLRFLNSSNVVQALFQPNFSVTATSSCNSAYPATYAGLATTPGNTLYASTNWIYGSADLSAFVGDYVTFQLTVGDCSALGHASYLYFDAACSTLTFTADSTGYSLDSSNVVCSSTLPVLLNAPMGVASYTWNGPSGSGISNVTSGAISAPAYGTYSLQLGTLGTCCSYPKFITVTPCTGINSLTNSNEMYLYPNPAKNEFYIKNLSGDYEYTIKDVLGKVVRVNTPMPESQSQINIESLNAGIYFITIFSEGKSKTFRIAKE